jgi:hypothetical protein
MKHAFSAFVVLAVLTAAAPVAGQDTEWNRYTLEELAGVHVRTDVGDGCLSAGVSLETVRADTEAALVSAEIPVLTEAAMLEAPGLPELRIRLDCAQADGVVGFAVSLQIQQAVQMIRDTQITLPDAVTWFVDSVGVVAANDVGAAVQGALDTKLQAFTAAYAAANADEEAAAN